MRKSRFRLTVLVVSAAACIAGGLFAATSGSASGRAASAGPGASPVQAAASRPAAPSTAVVAASGTNQRTFVSAASGNDANPCTRTAPCRNFAAAIAQTASGGEVIALDSGGYGPVTINQSVSLIAPQGVYAGITAFSGNAIEVNAGTGDTVMLRGLTLNGLGGGIGVNVDSVGHLYVDNVTIKGFNNVAMEIVTSADSDIYVQDSLIQNNFIGIRFRPLGGTERGWIDNTRAEGNSYAFENRDSSIVTMNHDAAIRTAVTGYGTFFSGAEMNIEDSLASNDQFGIVASSGATRVSETMVVDNDTGLNGSATSFGNNRVYANTTNGSFTTTVPQT
jgi:hypothetical protein